MSMKALYSSASALFLAAALVAQSGTESAKSEYDALVKEHATAVAEWRAAMDVVRKSEEYKAARAARDNEATRELTNSVARPDIDAFVARFAEAGKRYSGEEEALQFHLWIVMNGGAKQKDEILVAVNAVVADHLDSKALQPPQFRSNMLSRSIGQERYLEIVDLIVAKSPHDMVKAHALHGKAQGMMGRNASEEDKAKALVILDQVAELAKGDPLEVRARGPRFEAERLQIGMLAPDIVADDLDGVEFKLSDYRGKVVVIDFWGDW